MSTCKIFITYYQLQINSNSYFFNQLGRLIDTKKYTLIFIDIFADILTTRLHFEGIGLNMATSLHFIGIGLRMATRLHFLGIGLRMATRLHFIGIGLRRATRLHFLGIGLSRATCHHLLGRHFDNFQ